MKAAKAKEIVSIDIERLNLEALQKHKVKLLDAWRESKAEYGMAQAVRDGYYIQTGENASEYTPTDLWLTQNLGTALDRAEAREQKLLAQSSEQP